MRLLDRDQIAALADRLRSGDARAFDDLFCHFEPRVYAFACKLTRDREESKEVVQEAFTRVWEKRQTINPQYGFEGFLYTIVRNLVYNKVKHQVYVHAYRAYTSLLTRAENRTEEEVHYNELSALIDKVCSGLPPVRREVFMMSRMEGLSNDDIAQRLNTSTSNIKNHINKALRTIREQIHLHELVPLFVLLFAEAFGA